MLVSAIHFRPVHRDPEASAARLLPLIELALDMGARLVVAPELCLSGFAFATPDEMHPYAQDANGQFGQELARLSAKYTSTIVAGISEVDGDGLLYNTALVATKSGGLATVRAPRYPHNYGWVTGFGGEDDSTFTTDIGPLRVLLCAGLLLRPPWTGRSGILAIPAAWNDEPPGSCLPLWRNLAQQRGWAMVVANRYGFEEYAKGDRCDFSQAVSCIVDSNGDVVQSMRSEGSGAVLISEVSGPEPELRRAPWMTGGAEPTDFAPPGPQR